MDLKWFESKVGNKYLNEAAGLAAEEADVKDLKKNKVNISSMLSPYEGFFIPLICSCTHLKL